MTQNSYSWVFTHMKWNYSFICMNVLYIQIYTLYYVLYYTITFMQMFRATSFMITQSWK